MTRIPFKHGTPLHNKILAYIHPRTWLHWRIQVALMLLNPLHRHPSIICGMNATSIDWTPRSQSGGFCCDNNIVSGDAGYGIQFHVSTP